jgi:hypothetical protein
MFSDRKVLNILKSSFVPRIEYEYQFFDFVFKRCLWLIFKKNKNGDLKKSPFRYYKKTLFFLQADYLKKKPIGPISVFTESITVPVP